MSITRYYTQLESFSLPNSAVRWAIDVTPTDGRLLIVNGSEVLREDKPRTRNFQKVADLASDPPGVLRISPGNVKAATISSAGNSLLIFDPKNGNIIETQASGAGNFFYDAEWYSDSILAVTEAIGGASPSVKIFDFDLDQSKIVIRNIGAASGGVTFNQAGWLFAGNGFSSEADDETGLIKVYSTAVWQLAWDNNQPIDFEDRNIGVAIANLLSGAYLGFDRFDNFHVGGGDISSSAPDNDYTAVVFKSTLDNILADREVPVTSLAPVRPQDPLGVWQKLDPDPRQNLAWLAHANRVTGELMITAFEDPLIYNYFLTTEEIQLGTRTVTFAANYQLGDNPGYYPGTAFVDFDLIVPLPLPALASFAGDLTLLIETEYMETFGGQSRHPVSLGGVMIGNLQDDFSTSDNEKFTFNISRTTLATIIGTGNPSTLAIKCQKLLGGLSDDFIVRKYGYSVAA